MAFSSCCDFLCDSLALTSRPRARDGIVKYVILFGGVVVRDATMVDIRCRRCDRHGCLSLPRLVAQHGLDAAVGTIMQAQIGACPNRDSAQWHTRSRPYCPMLVQPFQTPEVG